MTEEEKRMRVIKVHCKELNNIWEQMSYTSMNMNREYTDDCYLDDNERDLKSYITRLEFILKSYQEVNKVVRENDTTKD